MYYEAEEMVLNAQSYTLGSKQLTRADLSEIRQQIEYLENVIDSLESRGTTKRKTARAVPID
jgi:ferritin-like metal-binding protein YciE